jgi:hypothetical protein
LNTISLAIEDLLKDEEYGLDLELIAGEKGISHRIYSSRIQKPGLALTGFTAHVHPDRLQVLGLTEIDFLATLTPEARAQGIDACDVHQESHACCCCCGAKPKAQTSKHDNSIVLIQSLKCSGIASDWLAIGMATIPVDPDWQFQLIPYGIVECSTLDAVSPAFEPLLPPPRQTVT